MHKTRTAPEVKLEPFRGGRQFLSVSLDCCGCTRGSRGGRERAVGPEVTCWIPKWAKSGVSGKHMENGIPRKCGKSFAPDHGPRRPTRPGPRHKDTPGLSSESGEQGSQFPKTPQRCLQGERPRTQHRRNLPDTQPSASSRGPQTADSCADANDLPLGVSHRTVFKRVSSSSARKQRDGGCDAQERAGGGRAAGGQ